MNKSTGLQGIHKNLDPQEIAMLYEKGMNTSAIARRLGCAEPSVRYHLKKTGMGPAGLPRTATSIDPVAVALSGMHFKRELNLAQIVKLQSDVARLDAAIAALEGVEQVQP